MAFLFLFSFDFGILRTVFGRAKCLFTTTLKNVNNSMGSWGVTKHMVVLQC